MKDRYLLKRVNSTSPIEESQKVFDDANVQGWKLKDVYISLRKDDIEQYLFVFYKIEQDD